jgi:hypothetical protein
LEGRIWGWDWHYLVDGALGVYGTVKVGGQLALPGISYEACKEKFTGELSGSLLVSGEVAGKAELNGCLFGLCADFTFKPLAVGVEGGFNFFKINEQFETQRNDFVTVYLRGELEINSSRKLQLMNLSKTWNSANTGGSLRNTIKSLAN